MNESKWLTYLRSLVQELEEKGCFRWPWLKEAVLHVPRHLFVPYRWDGDARRHVGLDPQDLTDDDLREIYTDVPLCIRPDPSPSSSSQPSLVLGMLYDLQVEPGDKVLEIGAGSGWNAGLLAFRVGDDRLIYSIDIQEDVVEDARAHLRAAGFPNVNLRAADGGYGWPEAAPFDRIIVTCGSPDIPPAWTDQLADGGVLLLPFKTAAIGDPVLRLRKRGRAVRGEFTRGSGFMPLQGAFSSDLEDPVLFSCAPATEQLLAHKPKRVAMSTHLAERTGRERLLLFLDLLLFLCVKGLRFRYMVPRERRPGRLDIYLDPVSHSICDLPEDEPLFDVYGDESVAQRLAELQEEWIALGRPRITDYEVELVGPAVTADKPNTWLDKRPHATLKLCLPTD